MLHTWPRTAILTVALVLCALAGACGSSPEPRTGIAGSVRDWGAFGGTVPARDVEVVCLDAATGKQAARTQTDRQGKFFLSVPAGRYKVDYASGGKPGWPVVEVEEGRVTTMEPFVGRRWGPHASPPEERIRALLRPEARTLGMEKKTAVLLVSGATVGAASKLFGAPSGIPANSHVWVCVLTGDVSGSPSDRAARDLSHGGFVAYELRTGTLERLAVRSSPQKWRLLDWTGPDDWGGTLGSPLW